MLTSSSPATPHTLVESKALPFMALVERLEVKWTEDKAFTHTSTMIQSQTKATSKLLEQYAQLKSEMQQVADELKQSQPSVSKADLNIRLTLLTQKISPLKEALGRQAIACFKQGAACAAQDQFAEAFASYCLTLRLLKVIPDNLTMLIMSVVSNIGTLFYHTGRYKDAIECYQATLLEGERIYGKGSRELASSCHHLANALLKIDQWQEALVYYQLAFNYLESKSKPTISAISSTTVPSISQQRIVPTSPLSIVEVLNGMGNVFLAQRKWEEALSYFKKAYDPVKNKESMEGAMIFNNMALILARQGKREQAFNDLSQVYKIYLKNVGKKHSLVALVLMNLGRVRCSQNRYREAFTYFNESLVIRKEIFGDESIHVAEILHEMGMAFLHQSQYAKAKECHQRALTIYRKATGETSLFVASAWDYLAHVHFECEEYENALSFYQKSLTIYKQSIHIASIPYAIVLQNMANVYVKQHHYPLAAKLLDEAEAIINQAPGGQSEEAAELFFNRGNLAVEGNPAQALKYYHQALAIKTRLFGNKSSQVATLLLNIGSAYAKQSQYQEAFTYLNTAYSLLIQGEGRESIEVVTALNNLSTVFIAQGDYHKALQYLRQAHVLQEKLVGKSDFQTASFLMKISEVLIEQGKHQEAYSNCQKALTLMKRVSGRNDKEIANLFANMGNVLAEHKAYREAEDYYQQALALITDESEKAVVVGYRSLLQVRQGRYEEALKLAHEVLKLQEKRPESQAATLNNIGSLYREQGKDKEALPYYHQALAIYQACYQSTHHTLCMMHQRLARTYMAMAVAQEDKEAIENHQNAMRHFEKVLATNRLLLQERSHELNLYDWAGHNHALAELALAYIHAGSPEKAGMLYYQEAKSSYKIPVALIDYYSTQAIFYLKHLPSYEKTLGELYRTSAQIAYERSCYSLAIKSLKKSFTYVTGTVSELQQLAAWQQVQTEHIHYLGADFATQLEECFVSYYEIPLLLLRHFEKNPQPSDDINNRVTELAIKINHLLDSAFGRFVREAIYEPNHSPDRTDLYYPMSVSHASFIRELKEKQIINDPLEIKDEVLHVRGPQGISLLKALQDEGYLDQKNCVSEKVKNDPMLMDLKDEMATVRSELALLLKETGVGQCLTKARLKLLNKKIMEDPSYRPPAKEAVAAHLADKGILVPLPRPGSAKPSYRLSDAFVLLQPGSFNKLGEGKIETHQWMRYADSIRKNIEVEHTLRQSLRSLEKDFKEVFTLLESEQPFHYYSDNSNQQNPEVWHHSWLDKILAISNNSKHIGLTPQRISDNLAERFGTLCRYHITLHVHYIESSFCSWTFAPLLKQLLPLEGPALLAASHQVFQLLKEKGYLQKGIVIHPLAKEYLTATRLKKDNPAREMLEQKLTDQLEGDLPAALKPTASVIANMLLRRSLQMSSLELYADSTCEFHGLFETALKRASAILLILSQAKARAQKKAILPAEVKVPSTSFAMIKEDKKKTPSPPVDYEKAKTIEEKEWPLYHRWLNHRVQLHLKSKELSLAGNCYHQAAKLAFTYPALSLYYYQKAYHFYSISAKQQGPLQVVCLALSSQYMKNGLGRAAIRSLAQGGRYLLGSQAKALREKQQACEAELKKQFSHIDEDIASQLHYAREKFLQLEQLHFKLSCDPEKKEIQHQMLQYAADICIKLRHLLDQSFTRLIHAHIYVPNNKWVEIHIKTTIKFYAYASLKDLNDDLMKKEIIHTGSEKVSLSLDYPEVYQLLIEAQPFTAGEDSQWLKDLIMLSNQAKHIGLLSLETTSDKNTTETLIQRMALCKKALIQTEKIIQAIYKAISLRSQQAFLSEEKEKARDLKPVEEKKRAEEVKDMTLIKMPQGMVLAPASYAASQVMFFKKLSDQEFIKRRHNNAAEQRKYDQIFGLIVR